MKRSLPILFLLAAFLLAACGLRVTHVKCEKQVHITIEDVAGSQQSLVTVNCGAVRLQFYYCDSARLMCPPEVEKPAVICERGDYHEVRIELGETTRGTCK